MTYRRNARRHAIAGRDWVAKPKTQQAILHRQFWVTTEPARHVQRIHAALLRARDHDDARRARKGLKPRDTFWQRVGAVRE